MNKKIVSMFLLGALLTSSQSYAGGWFGFLNGKPNVGFNADLPNGNLSTGQKNFVAGIAYGAIVPAIIALTHKPFKVWYAKENKTLESKLLGCSACAFAAAAILWAGLSSLNSFAGSAGN